MFVTLAQKQGHVLFAIKNTGVSLSQEELTHIFDRFYRVDQARSSHPDASGFGLGLAIAQNAVLRSKGSIKASSDDDSVTIEIRL